MGAAASDSVLLSSHRASFAINEPVEKAVVAAIVSHDRLLRDGVQAILQGRGISVGFSASLIQDFVSTLGKNSDPDVLILIGALPSCAEDVAALRAARELAPNLRIIAFANHDAGPILLGHLVSVGVDALLPTDLSAEVLVQSIRLVLLGEGFMFIEFVHRMLEREPAYEVPTPDLTTREIDIIRSMAEGHSNRTIAGWLNATEAAVKVEIRRLLRKLGATNRTQAAIWAMERGLVRDHESNLMDRERPSG